MTTPISRYRVRCLTESANVYTWSATAPTVCPNDSGHSIASAATVAVETREPINLIVDAPIEPVIPGASKVIANDRPAIEIASGITGYGAIQAVWPHPQNDAAIIELRFCVVLESSGTGTTTRLIARAKAHGDGEDSSATWADVQAIDMPVNHTTIGTVFCGTIQLDASAFDEGDAVALQVGRDGSHANDTLSVPLDIIAIEGHAL